jgi:predicted ATP-grasp superfamily ATP-dependent carboligase
VYVSSLGEAPDPGGAAILLEAVAELFPQAKVDTGPLREQAEMIKRQLEELLKMQQKYTEEYEKGEKRPETERFYK